MSYYRICPNCGKGTAVRYATDDSLCGECSDNSSNTDKLSVEKLQKELESCIQTLIEASAAATIMQDIVVGNLVDRKLADLAKTHKLAVDYIEKVTGKNIDVVLAENAALEAEEDE
ncbi:MAG: hypothetical protein L0J96_09060 [Lactococcus lactis]|nr:hypothetical protein [Lactococcus lactis]MDN5438766.1 hypothetical protein [Lactococcus lactis]MDN5947700.1 hypothetical protein [Lactococcus lactis]MDN5950310.1 hypothetical protein [Lactococcus lactis]MDN5960823.1 hypothetical protein [Lactococcus lactis]